MKVFAYRRRTNRKYAAESVFGGNAEPKEEYSPIKGMSELIERYACFLYKELQARVQEQEKINAKLAEIMDKLEKSGNK